VCCIIVSFILVAVVYIYGSVDIRLFAGRKLFVNKWVTDTDLREPPADCMTDKRELNFHYFIAVVVCYSVSNARKLHGLYCVLCYLRLCVMFLEVRTLSSVG
jgi:hypothetical protein